MGSGRLCVATHGTSERQRWSVGSWGFSMLTWHCREPPLGKDKVASGVGSGPAGEMRVAWRVAVAEILLALTQKMHLLSALDVVSVALSIMKLNIHHSLIV